MTQHGTELMTRNVLVYSQIATIRESNKGFACRILNHAKFDHSERLPEGDLCIALLLGFSGSPTHRMTLFKAVFDFVSDTNNSKPHTPDCVAQGCVCFVLEK